MRCTQLCKDAGKGTYVDNDASDMLLYAASRATVPTESSTKKVSGSMGNATSYFLPGFCPATISRARSMLSACIATLKRDVPLLTYTDILIISAHPLPA